VAYKNFNEKTFRTSTRPIHKVVLVVPAEDADLPPLLPPSHNDPSARLASPTEGTAQQPDVDPLPTVPVELEVAPPTLSEAPSDALQEVAVQEEVPIVTAPTGDSTTTVNPPPNLPPADESLETPEATEGHPAEQEAPRGPQKNLTVKEDPSAQPGDRTHGGRLRPRKTFYSWDFPDRMRKN
jgi:hypothetical protein